MPEPGTDSEDRVRELRRFIENWAETDLRDQVPVYYDIARGLAGTLAPMGEVQALDLDVVLLPGLGSSPRSMLPLKRALARAGVGTVQVDPQETVRRPPPVDTAPVEGPCAALAVEQPSADQSLGVRHPPLSPSKPIVAW